MPVRLTEILAIPSKILVEAVRTCTVIQRRVNRLHTSMTIDPTNRSGLDNR